MAGQCLALTLQGHRLMQYNSPMGLQLGSWKSSINTEAVGVDVPVAARGRRIVVARAEEISVETALEAVGDTGMGIIIVLPMIEGLATIKGDEAPEVVEERRQEKRVMSSEMISKVRSLEEALLNSSSKSPVYFVFETPELEKLMDQDDETSSTILSPRLVKDPFRDISTVYARPPAASKINAFEGFNFQGWLSGEPNAPTIALITHYDAFAASPAMAYGADSSASGVAAFFEIARLLKNASQSYGRLKYNVLFLLTTGASFDFAGAENWLSDAEPKLLHSIEFALCLDSLLPPSSHLPELHLHVSKQHTAGGMALFTDVLRKAAPLTDVEASVVVKKVKVADTVTPWQHEKFTVHKVVSGTLSHIEAAKDFRSRSSVLDQDFSLEAVNRTAILLRPIAEAIGHVVFDIQDPDVQVFETGHLTVSVEHLNSWFHFMHRTPRFYPFINPKATGYKLLLDQLQSSLSKYLTSVERKVYRVVSDEITSMGSYYIDPATIRIDIKRSKGLSFDLTHLAFNVAILVLVMVGLHGVEGSKKIIHQFMEGGKTSKIGKGK
eukprot:GHVN01086603.1.p1 GENE.GHVN01086603.1~~GHVN01086603.1.p1  ORF type:complete len:598 (+),score=117.94 GHVN01086603.1:138-1796(+)